MAGPAGAATGGTPRKYRRNTFRLRDK
jgi:hypothetical protein